MIYPFGLEYEALFRQQEAVRQAQQARLIRLAVGRPARGPGSAARLLGRVAGLCGRTLVVWGQRLQALDTGQRLDALLERDRSCGPALAAGETAASRSEALLW